MKMLYAKFNKFSPVDFKYYFNHGACSNLSSVEYIDEGEGFLNKALVVAANNHITCEPSGIAGLAMFFQLIDELNIKKDDKIVS
ncbi:MAG: hypothetical protein IPL25_03720 [Saprospiraceae bacterium]|nr:hypothetical protein [Candidatus Vicinibacter affinis]